MSQATKAKKSHLLIAFSAFSLTILTLVAIFAAQVLRNTGSEAEAAELPFAAPAAGLNELPPIQTTIAALPQFNADLLAVLVDLGLTVSDLEALPRPAIDNILPAGLGTVDFDDLTTYAAVPRFSLTPAVASPGEAPVLALEMFTDAVIEPLEGRWTVVGFEPGLDGEPGWVRVIVPVGRGALPSDDAAAVNHQAVWVPESLVWLEEELNRIEVNLTDRRVTVFHADNVVGSFHVGIGVIGQTDTPVGLCSVIGATLIQTGEESLLTSCQSEMLDVYAGSGWATIALHEGTGFNVNTGGAISNGCVRVPAADFATYLAEIPVGTPVLFIP